MTRSRVQQPWRRLAALVGVAGLVGFLPVAAPAAAAPQIDDPAPASLPSDGYELVPDGRGDAPHKAEQIPALAYSLQDDAGRPTAGRPVPAAPGDAPGTVTVAVEAADPADARAAVVSVGGVVVREAGGVVKADVRPDRLAALAGADGIRRVGQPRPVTMDVPPDSEGILETGSNVWHTGGVGGAGTRVAIVDGGFAGYTALLGNELPAGTVPDLTRCGGSPGGSSHGTAVAEIVHDVAPDAAILLICIQDHLDFIDALDQLPADVDVVNGSIGFTLLDRGDGSGPVSAAVARARERGVLYVAAAGNSEGSHRHQNAVGDTPGASLEDRVNLPGGDDALTFAVAPFGSVEVSLQWDAWPTTSLDLDLYLANEASIIVTGSEGIQNGNDPPVEAAFVTNTTGSTQIYFVLVNRFAGTGTPRLDLFFNGEGAGIEAPTSSSISDPAVSSAAFTAGAHCYADGTTEFFSSRGPTIDGRTKPDISGPDATSSSVYGDADGCASSGFFGTSAASPHVAGAAALVLEANPELDVAELQQVLEGKAQGAGAAGIDNVYGHGRLRLGPAGVATVATARPFTPRAPVRLFDSRAGTPYPSESPNRTTPLGAGGKVRVRVAGIAGVPTDATAVVLNVTAVAPTAGGYVTVYPGSAVPTASNLNFAPAQTVAVHVTATVGADDKVELFNAAGSTHLIVDLAGWYGPTGAGGPATDLLHTLAAPARAMDTRAGGTVGYAETDPGGVTQPVGAGQTLSVKVAGLGGVPIGATAVVMNVTATAPTRTTFVAAYPDGGAQPDTSSLNLTAGKTVANLVVLPVGIDGRVRYFNAAGATHLVVDTIGWFAPGAGGAGYVALDPPTRDLDTRTGTGLRKGSLGAGGTHRLKVDRYDGVPADALAVMLGVVAVSPTAGGFLTVYPGTQPVPSSSNVNFAAGTITPNAVLTGIGTDGTVAFRNAAGSTHVISDLAGYFIDPANQPVP